MKRFKSKRIIIPAVIIIILFLVSVMPYWRDIDITLQGVQFRSYDEDTLLISAPAYNREQAIDIMKELANFWVPYVKWK